MLTIEEPSGSEAKIIPFVLWSAQRELAPILFNERRLLFLKARQLGITWLILAYLLYSCWYQAGTVVLVFSQGEKEAQELVRRIKGMADRYPSPPSNLTENNTEVLRWLNGSSVRSLAATQKAGRSFTASIVFMDEYAFMVYGSQVYTAVKPAADAGNAQIILNSTANGDDDDFAIKWRQAETGQSTFKSIFLPWSARPDRTQDWYEQTARDAVSMADHLREYPATPDEAFTPRTEERFLDDMLLWDRLRVALPVPTRYEPMILAADAAVSGDTFALVAVSGWTGGLHAVRWVRAYVPNGQPLDYALMDADVREFCQNYNVIGFTYDPYQLHKFATDLHRDGVVMIIPFNQGNDRAIADKQLFDAIRNRSLVHNGDVTLRDHLANANKKTANDKTLRLVKRSASKKIDCAVTLSMAYDRALRMGL